MTTAPVFTGQDTNSRLGGTPETATQGDPHAQRPGMLTPAVRVPRIAGALPLSASSGPDREARPRILVGGGRGQFAALHGVVKIWGGFGMLRWGRRDIQGLIRVAGNRTRLDTGAAQ